MTELTFKKTNTVPVTGDPNVFGATPTVVDATLLDLWASSSDGSNIKKMASLGGNIPLPTTLLNDFVDRTIIPNKLKYHGSGTDGNLYITDTGGNLTSTIEPDTILRPSYYGSVTSVDAWFQHNNGSFGGNRPALSQDVIDLLAAMGRTGSDRRYGRPFVLIKTTTPADMSGSTINPVVQDSTDYYAASLTNVRMKNNYSTYSMWVRAVNKNIRVYATWKNDVVVSGNPNTYTPIILTPAEGWVHISTTMNNAGNYEYFFRIWNQEGGENLIALPYASGNYHPLSMAQHCAPVN